MRLILFLLIGVLIATLVPSQASLADPPIDLDQGWEYRWGDSPFRDDGLPTWVEKPGGEEEWQSIAFPSNPPGREGRKNVWFRITLPQGDWRDPVLYIYSVDLITQVWLENEPIYQYGHFDEAGQGRFEGWPWHMISLPEDFAGKTLYFRVFSDYTDIGLWGEVKLMDRPVLLGYILTRSAADLIISAFCLLLALLAGIFTLIQRSRRNFAAISLFSLASGIMILAETQARQLLLEAPLLWNMLAAAGYFSLPVAMGLLLEQWFRDTPRTLIRRLWQFHLTYLVLAIGMSMAGLVTIAQTFPVFDALFAITLVLLFSILVHQLGSLGIEQKLIISAYGLFGLLLLVDMAVAHSLLPWNRVPVSAGALSFTLVIAGISIWHYGQTQAELKRLNQRLEEEVAERTRDLQIMVEKLHGFSYQDALTGLHNRRYFDEILEHEAAMASRHGTPLSLAMIDIDHFKKFNDREGHEAGDSVLIEMGRILTHHFREADIICRLGGEEFVVIMPGATPQEAKSRLSELMDILGRVRFRHKTRELGKISVSCGIAAYPDHAEEPLSLIGLADKAMYTAKHRGRARVEIYA